jgi:uncharacterized Zn finger protein (UPF0148 family)
MRGLNCTSMPDDDLFQFECLFCAQRIEVHRNAQGEDVQCPACGKTVRVPSFEEPEPPVEPSKKIRVTLSQKPPEVQPQSAASNGRKPLTFASAVGFLIALFLVVTAGVYCGEWLSSKNAAQNPNAQCEYRLEAVDPETTFFPAGRDLIEAQMNRFKGREGWELKGVLPATRNGKTQAVLIYGKTIPTMSPAMQAITDAQLDKEIDEAISKSVKQQSERETLEYEERLKHASE